MLYAAIRQWLRDHAYDGEASKIQNEFIGISEIGEQQDEPRIVMNITNREVFQEIVVNPCPDASLLKRQFEAGRYSSTRKLVDAAMRYRQLIEALTESQGADQQKQAAALFDLAKYLRDRVLVNCLDVTAPEDAYTIFETLNDRGIDLSVLDLLKNHLLRQTKDADQEQIQTNWIKMLAKLGDRQGDDFLKVFWTSRFGRIQRGRLFHELKKRYSDEAAVLRLSQELAAAADTYANLEVADSDVWSECSTTTQEYVRSLSLLGGRQMHPILLAAVERFNPKELERLLRRLVTLIVRYQLIGRGRTGLLEIRAASVATSIYNEKLKNTNAVWTELKTLLPTDEEFEEDFRRYEEPKSQRARWLLSELEALAWMAENPGKPLQKVPLTDAEKINLEHILPKNPDSDWGSIVTGDPQHLTDCVDRLGNLCLLDKAANLKQAARAFQWKAPAYKDSEFVLTRVVGSASVWDRGAIDARQTQLAKLALKAWVVN